MLVHNDKLQTNITTSSQVAEHPTSIAEVISSNPVQALIFFRPYFHCCLSSVHYFEYCFHIHFLICIQVYIYIQEVCKSIFAWNSAQYVEAEQSKYYERKKGRKNVASFFPLIIFIYICICLSINTIYKCLTLKAFWEEAYTFNSKCSPFCG